MRKNDLWKKAVAVITAGTMIGALGGCAANDASVKEATVMQTAAKSAAAQDETKTLEETATDSKDSAKLEKTLTTMTSAEDEKGDEVDKEETVYVIADAAGTAKNIIVSEWLKANGEKELDDHSNLTDIKNVKGDETYKETGAGLKWSADGKDIYYQGTSKEKLPVSVKVTYYLDGKEIAPKDLKGKSGQVKIRYDYKNEATQKVTVNGKSEEVAVPFVMATGVILPVDDFSNVKVTNGELISEGNNMIAIGMGMPGLAESLKLDDNKDLKLDKEIPEYFEIVADAEDFQLGMSMTVCSNALLDMKDFDLKDSFNKVEKDVDTLSDGADQLQKGSEELYKGTNELKDGSSALVSGVKELNDGVKTYTDGVSSAKKGAGALAGGAKELDEGAGNLVAGIQTAKSGAGELYQGLGKLNASAPKLVEGIKAAKAGAGQLQAGYEGEQGALQGSKALAAGLEALNQSVCGLALPEMGSAGLTEEQKAAIAGQVTAFLENDESGRALVGQATQNYIASVTGLLAQNGVTLDEQTEAVLSAVLEGTFQQAFVNVYVSAYETGAQKGVELTAGQVMAQMSEFSPKLTQLQQAVGQLSAGATALEGGMEALYGGTKELAAGLDAMDQASGELTGGVNALCEGSGKLNNGLGALYEGAGTLKNGTAALNQGAGELSVGCMTLDAASSKILNGFTTLADGTTKLDDGVSKLNAGALELKDGVVKFNDEGISKIKSLVKGDLAKMTDRVQAISDANDAYELYGGIADGQKGREKFIIKIEGIE